MIDRVLEPRLAKLAGSLTVLRVLPRGGRGVGPFLFLDHMGPWNYEPGGPSFDVPPHPHIGLSTLTYLLEGELVHRDSLGTEQTIRPGEVNWMTAGNGVVHSERLSETMRQRSFRVHGLQAWVALPESLETMAPEFSHHGTEEIPERTQSGVRLRLVAGALDDLRSPVPTHSKLHFAEVNLEPAARLELNLGAAIETAFYLMEGAVQIDGQTIAAPNLLVFQTGQSFAFTAEQRSFGVLLGGETLGPRIIEWNFVATRRELVDQAKQRWRAQTFPKIPGETEFVPLPADRR